MHLTLDKLGSAPPARIVTVPVPEYGDGVVAHLREMDALERDTRIVAWWQDYCAKQGNTRAIGFTAWAVAASLCDENKQWLCGDAAAVAAAAEKLIGDAVLVVTRCFLRASELQALNKEDVEELEKNSQGGG